jgi:hypothetical protein
MARASCSCLRGTLERNACANFVFVGWDVAFTPHGAMILEGNENWSAEPYQVLRDEPLGRTKFADILAIQSRRRGLA